jgi:hypothetical protein
MSLENFTTKLKNAIIDLSYNNHYLHDVSLNISTIINYITNDPYLEAELEFYDNKLKNCINTIYNKLENTGKQHTTFYALTKNVDVSDNTTYENYETKRANDDTFYDNFQNNKGSGKEVLNDDFKTKIEAKRNNNSLNYSTNMLGNYIGYFGLSTGNFNSSTTFYYMNLKPTNKLTTISGGEIETNTKAKASYETTSVNNVSIKILLEILTLNQCPYFYSYSFKGNVCYCPIFEVVNGLIVSSELFPDNTYLQFTYSSSNDLTNNNNITSNQTPKWSWVRIYENEENQGDTNFGNTNPNSNKSAYLYYVYTNDSNGPQTNFLFPSNLPDYCPDGIILPWTITLYENNGNVLNTFNATQGASNFYSTLFSSAQNMSGVIANAVYNKLGYYPSNL